MGYITFKCLKQKGREGGRRGGGLQGRERTTRVMALSACVEDLRSSYDKSYCNDIQHTTCSELSVAMLE